jgi:hypothetical protein
VRHAGRGAHGIATVPLAALLALAIFLIGAPARAAVNLQVPDPTAPPSYVPPGANLAPAQPPREPVTSKWWFWAAIGGAVVTTVVVVLVASRPPSPPGSTLGNMDAFKGK